MSRNEKARQESCADTSERDSPDRSAIPSMIALSKRVHPNSRATISAICDPPDPYMREMVMNGTRAQRPMNLSRTSSFTSNPS